MLDRFERNTGRALWRDSVAAPKPQTAAYADSRAAAFVLCLPPHNFIVGDGFTLLTEASNLSNASAPSTRSASGLGFLLL